MLTHHYLPGNLSVLVLTSKVEYTNQYHYRIWATDNSDKMADMLAAYTQSDISRCKWSSDITSEFPIVATSDYVLESVILALLRMINPNLLYTDLRKVEKLLADIILT